MFGTSIGKSLIRGKGVAAAVLVATAALGACVPMGPGFGIGPGLGGGVPPLPAPEPAPEPIANLACEQRVGANGGRGFGDVGRGECWSCPLGSARTLFPVNENWACSFGGMLSTAWAPAEFLGRW